MKQQPIDNSKVQTNGVQDSVQFGIKSSGLHHVLGILRDQLYSDKTLAVIREYSTNAVDAHVEAGCADKPIQVTLPNRLNPNFIVRDFGPALSQDEIHDVYAFYGESTKRNSNEVTGMLGIGSKAGFAYGDNFVIHSFLDGKKHIYNAFIDPSQVGQISKIGEVDTDEDNGVEIVIPVKSGDFDEFKEKSENLFKHFNVKPVIKGCSSFKYNEKTLLEAEDGSWKILQGEQSRYGGEETVAVMGNIGYPINKYDLNLKGDTGLDCLFAGGLIFVANIGDLDISASREKLQYTDRTRKSLINILNKIKNQIGDRIAAKFDDCKSLFEVKCLIGSIFNYGSPLYSYRETIQNKLKWKGKKVTTDHFDTEYDDGSGKKANIVLTTYSKGYRATRYKSETANNGGYINCDARTIVIKNDLPDMRNTMGRVLPFILEQDKKPFVLSFPSAAVETLWKKEQQFDGEILVMSELPKRPMKDFYGASAGSTSTYEKNSKHTSKEFVMNMDSVSHWNSKKSDYWTQVDVDLDNETGYYVIIDKFLIESCDNESMKHESYSNLSDPRSFHRFRESLEKMGLDLPTVYGFKKSKASKIKGKENWKPLFPYLKEQFEQKLKDDNLLQKFVDSHHIADLQVPFVRYGLDSNHAKEWLKSLSSSIVSEDSIMKLFVDDLLEAVKASKMAGIAAAQDISESLYGRGNNSPLDTKKYAPTHDLHNRTEEVMDKYSMLHLVDSWKMNRDDSGGDSKLANYVNVVDLTSVPESQ
tara:strand:- start:1569 stop:3836 length:2268 start_codon:yes stop_codon:yes gene_type:complete